MKDEIKEILNIERYRNKDGYVENIKLLPEEIHKLLDYITNLQEENEKQRDYICDLVSDKVKYKSRNEKAIEYLEIGLSNYEEQEELLNILKGDNK